MTKTVVAHLSFVVSSSMKELTQASRFQRELTRDECVTGIAAKLAAAVPALKGAETKMAEYVFDAFAMDAGGEATHYSTVVAYLGTPKGLGWLNAYAAGWLKGRFQFYRSSAEMEQAQREKRQARSKARRAPFIGGARQGPVFGPFIRDSLARGAKDRKGLH